MRTEGRPEAESEVASAAALASASSRACPCAKVSLKRFTGFSDFLSTIAFPVPDFKKMLTNRQFTVSDSDNILLSTGES